MEPIILLGIMGGMLFMVVVALLLVVLVKMVSIYKTTKHLISTVEDRVDAITNLILNEKQKKQEEKENVVDATDTK